MPPQEPQYSDLPQGAKVVGYTDLPAGAKVLSGQPAFQGDAPSHKFGPSVPHTPLPSFLPDLNQRVASALRPVGHPMEALRGVSQSVKDYQAQRNPNEGNWFTRGLGVLGKGVADTASDYWEHPGHLAGDITSGAILGMAGSKPSLPPVEVGSTEGIPWGTGGKGPIDLRGKMIPAEPPPIRYSPGTGPGSAPFAPGTHSQTILVRPSATAPTYEVPLPGVNVRPNVERLDMNPTSALQRASEPPAPANPSAAQLRPSIGRIREFTAKPVDPAAITPTTRAPLTSAPSGVKPVEASSKVAGERYIDYRLGEHAGKFDPTSSAHNRILQLGKDDLAGEANRIGFKGKSDWKGSDFVRSEKVHGKYNHPDAIALRNELIDEADRPAGTPSRMKGAQSKLPTPEQEARIKKSMVSRDAAKRDLEKPKEPVWPSQYSSSPRSLSSSGGGGANYSADDLAKIKAKYGIK
jgi:hypothetical protein